MIADLLLNVETDKRSRVCKLSCLSQARVLSRLQRRRSARGADLARDAKAGERTTLRPSTSSARAPAPPERVALSRSALLVAPSLPGAGPHTPITCHGAQRAPWLRCPAGFVRTDYGCGGLSRRTDLPTSCWRPCRASTLCPNITEWRHGMAARAIRNSRGWLSFWSIGRSGQPLVKSSKQPLVPWTRKKLVGAFFARCRLMMKMTAGSLSRLFG